MWLSLKLISRSELYTPFVHYFSCKHLLKFGWSGFWPFQMCRLCGCMLMGFGIKWQNGRGWAFGLFYLGSECHAMIDFCVCDDPWLEIPRPKTEFGRNSIKYRAVTIWNSLPNEHRIINNTENFKRKIKLIKTLHDFTFKKEACIITRKHSDFMYF